MSIYTSVNTVKIDIYCDAENENEAREKNYRELIKKLDYLSETHNCAGCTVIHEGNPYKNES